MTDAPDLTAAELGLLMKLTERQVKNRVAKKVFICHWRGGTEQHPRGMRFTPGDVKHNRSIGASRTQGAATAPVLSAAKIQKGVARLRRAQQTVSL
jgi:hypothetical protein